MVAVARAGNLPPPSASRPKSLSPHPSPPKMALVQDMADYTVDLVHDDLKTLLQVSLVSRVWVSRTRSYLFKSLKITDYKLLYLDPSCLLPLCKYVKTLHFAQTTSADPLYILRWFEHSEPHTLAVHSLELHILGQRTVRRCFEKFPCASITTLELHDISPTNETLLTLLSLFPNAGNLTISINEWKNGRPNSKETKTRSGGRKFASGSFKSFDPPGRRPWGCNRGKLLHTIATLLPQFQTASLGVKEQSWAEIEAFLDSCSSSLRNLFLMLPPRKFWSCIPSTVPHAQFANVQGVPSIPIGQTITILRSSKNYASVHQPMTLLPNTSTYSCVRSYHHVCDE